MSPSTSSPRQGRVTAERLTELANHLTDRDREIALALYEHRILTSSQLTLLFFSGRRRAMDRLLFLYRSGVLDRFYPPRPFAYGKPQAHWLLDEGGAHIVAACLGIDRRELPWRRRENWGTHPQLAHHLEVNTFVVELIAATLPHPAIGVTQWPGPVTLRDDPGLERPRLVPDAGFLLSTPAGVVDCVLEWDRGTEAGSVLERKLRRYSKAATYTRQLRCQGPAGVLARALATRHTGTRRGGVAMTRVCLYTRISTDEENQPTSLHSQKDRLESFCKVHDDWRVVAHYEDRATGTKLDRPASKPRSISHGAVARTCCSSTASTDSAARCASSRSSPRSWTASTWCCARRPSRSTPARQPVA